jgi:hypothetical protein
MADTKKKKDPIFRTPAGVLNYPFLQEPRGFKGDTDKMYYDTQLILEGAAAAEFAAIVDGFMKAAEKQFPGSPKDRPPIGPVSDRDRNVIQGKTAFKFRVPATSKNKKTGDVWDRKPMIVNAQGELDRALMDGSTKIGPGTKAKIAFTAYLRLNRGAAGVTLQPVGVQVLDLVTYGGRRVEDLGFGNESGSGGGDEDDGDIPF